MLRKNPVFLMIIFSLALCLSGCGSSIQKEKKDLGVPAMGNGSKSDHKPTDPKSRPEQPSPGIVAGSLEPSFTILEQKPGEFLLRYQLKNQTEKPKIFRFSSSQKFDYVIKDKQGKLIYQYSKNHMFMQVLTSLKIRQAETFTQDVMIKNLPPGTYTIEIWLTPQGEDSDYRQSLSFTI